MTTSDPVAEAYRRCRPQVLAATVRLTRDIDLAEDCVQDAMLRALQSWDQDPPRNPAAWLTTTARHLAVDRIRREGRLRAKLPLLVVPESGPDARQYPGVDPDDPLENHDLLSLVFLCCHPALASSGQVALTLRLLGGLTVPEIAAGLLLKEATVAARITRAKQKIAAAGIPFRVPAAADLPERLDAVLDVIHLIHTAGHTAAEGATLTRPDLAGTARDLVGMLARLLPRDSEVRGLLALCLLDDARLPARTDGAGALAVLAEQDRSGWDRDLLAAGLAAATAALRSGTGRYALQAAIAGLHAQAPSLAATDWAAVVTMYDGLLARWPNPVVAVNRLVAVSMLPGADPLAVLDELATFADHPALARYPYLPAVRAELLRRAGRTAEAATAYRAAIALNRNGPQDAYLRRRLRELG
ncbi:MAG: sigma-70 family RNA polymerase sigma factor [Austwickia sp.]|jgi:RNA polymerase sigma-70 factor (ECF subfamily)|nr:MAG: sigma-70 family RNA polymerase sigma factor [Austwickia sp.]